MTRESSEPSDENTNQLILAFSRVAGKSNTPLQQLTWNYGQPCAYPDQEVYYNGDSKPWYHIAEKDKYREACTRVDERYSKHSEIKPEPTEF